MEIVKISCQKRSAEQSDFKLAEIFLKNSQIYFEVIKFSGPEKNFFRQYQLLHFYFET